MTRHQHLILIIVLTCTTLALSPAAAVPTYVSEQDLFVLTSSAIVRMAPRADAPIAGRLPIGTKLKFWSRSADTANTSCPEAGSADSDEWLCVGTELSYEIGYTWSGWVSGSVVQTAAPRVEDLLAKLAKVPAGDLTERRKWAERAAALDPLNEATQNALLEVLQAIPDPAAVEATRRSFATYEAPQPHKSKKGDDAILFLAGNHIEPFAELVNGKLLLTSIDRGDADHEYLSRGNFYHLYSKGIHQGFAVTEAHFDCTVEPCPYSAPVRVLPDARASVPQLAIATTYALTTQGDATAPIAQIPALKKMAVAWTNTSNYGESKKKIFISLINTGTPGIETYPGQPSSVFAAWKLRDGRPFYVGYWEFGSMNDEHYGGDSDIDFYESLLVVAEGQTDGSLKATTIRSLKDGGCGYFDHADLDLDGTDELVLSCAQLEGSYSYSILKRAEDGQWSEVSWQESD